MNQPVESGTSVNNQEQGNVMVDEDYSISKEAFAKYVEGYQKLLEHVKLLENRNVELEKLLRQARESIGGKDTQGNSVAIDLSKAEELLQQALCQIVLPTGDVLTRMSTGITTPDFRRGITTLDFLNGKKCKPCSGTTTGLTNSDPPIGKPCCPKIDGVSPTKPE